MRAPLGVTATIDLTDKVTVSWQASTGATSYDVYSNTTPTSIGATLLAAGVGGTAYDDNSLEAETFRYYFIKAVAGATQSIFSGVATGWMEMAVPDAPTLDASPEAGLVYLSWNAVDRALFYEVYRDTVLIARIQATGGPYEYEDFDVTPHVPYQWQVFAGNFTGSTGSNIQELEANDPVPAAPNDVIASDGAFPSKVTIEWSTVPYATEYDIYRNGALLASGLVANTYDDIVASGALHTYSVKSRGESGESTDFSNEDTGYAAALAAPADVLATENDYDKVTITWSLVDGADTYKVLRDGVPVADGIAGTSYDDVPLAGSSAFYALVAVNTVEESVASSADLGTRRFLDEPAGFTATEDRTDGIECSWIAADGATEYDIWLNGSPVYTGVVGTSHLLDPFGLTTCQDYTLAVQARRVVSGLDDNYSGLSNTANGRVVPSAELCVGGAEVRSGGEVSHDETFAFCGGNWGVYFNASASIKDQIAVYLDGSLVWSSGCVTGEASNSFSTSAGYHEIRIVVTHRCDPLDPVSPTTSWTFTLECL